MLTPPRWSRVLALTVSLVVSAGVGTAQNTAVEDAFKQGATAMHNGRDREAEAAFREAVRLAPGLAEAHLDLGLVLGREGKLEDAILSIKQALRLNPALESANMFLGIFLHQTGREADASAALQYEVKLSPRNAEALTWLGTVELARGLPEKAAAAFDRAAEIQPDDLNVLEYRGRAHSMVARDSYARMAHLDPNSWHVHRVQAELDAEGGQHTEAIAEYQAALALETRNPDLYEGLGDQYRQTSQLELAEKAYARALELTPASAIAIYNLGSTKVERGDNAEGVKLLERMLKSYGPSPVAEYYLGRGLAAQDKDAEAAPWLEKSAHEDPNGEVGKRSFYELARVYRKLRRLPEAQKALASYNHLREEEQAKNARQVEDWRKLNAEPGTDAHPPNAAPPTP
jgi:Flp pilus assembly protein TadD